MSSIPPDNDLETRITRVLRAQPPRRAPATLAARVLAAVQQQHAPWYQRSFGTWPIPARLAFIATSLAVAALAIAGMPLLTEALHPVTRWAPVAARLMHSAYSTAALMLHLIPQAWLEAGAVFAGLLYLATFALGATAYRALYGRT